MVTEEDLAVVWDDEKEFCPGQEKWVNLPGTLAADNPKWNGIGNPTAAQMWN